MKALNFDFVIYIFMFLMTIINCNADEVKIKKMTTKGIVDIMVDKNIEELHFYKDYTTSIIDLDKLPKLKKITFMMMGFINDYSFVSNDNIKILAFDYCTIKSINFISNLPNLEVLFINSCDIKDFNLDLINNKKIKVIRFNNLSISGEKNRIKTIPNIINVPDSLKYLDMSFNEIEYISDDIIENTKNIDKIFIEGNNIKEREFGSGPYGNYFYSLDESILPEEAIGNNIW